MSNQVTAEFSKSILFSTTPIVQQPVPPVIVVGLPRSGSTYIAHVLSCFDDLYVFDDLYPYQFAKALNLAGNLTQHQRIPVGKRKFLPLLPIVNGKTLTSWKQPC